VTLRLLHLSDPHIQLPRWRERSLSELGPMRALASVELWKGRGRAYDDAAETLKAIARDADTLRADHVILTGDLTQLAHEEEFALAREALSPIVPRLQCIPGNHDRYPLGRQPNKLYEKYFPESTSMAPRPLGDQLVLFPVDTVGEVSWPVISHGRVTSGQLHQLARTLSDPAYAARCKLVLTHHAPTRRGGRRDWPLHDLRGARHLLRVSAENGADAILCGHVHERFDDAAREGRARVICAGSSTERKKEGYWLIEIENGRLASVTRRKLGGEPA
jgi:3',5'-cyclic AMP phosphodiesterase CpdA